MLCNTVREGLPPTRGLPPGNLTHPEARLWSQLETITQTHVSNHTLRALLFQFIIFPTKCAQAALHEVRSPYAAVIYSTSIIMSSTFIGNFS